MPGSGQLQSTPALVASASRMFSRMTASDRIDWGRKDQAVDMSYEQIEDRDIFSARRFELDNDMVSVRNT